MLCLRTLYQKKYYLFKQLQDDDAPSSDRGLFEDVR